MALGTVPRELSMPITNTMGYFVSFFEEENYVRARVLQWLLTEGLKQASQGRDEMVKKLNAALGTISATQQRPEEPGQLGVAVGESIVNEEDDTVSFQPLRDPVKRPIEAVQHSAVD